MSNFKKNAFFLAILSLFVIVCLVAPRPAAAAVDKAKLDSEEVSKLLAEAKSEAFELKKDAEVMESFAHSKLNWESHARVLEQVKEHVNAVGRLETKLQNVRVMAAPWQEQAIDQITPLLKELASYTEAAIHQLNANRGRLHSAEYQEYLKANYEVASELAALVTDFVDYGKTKSRYERLRDKLEVERP